MKLLSKCHVAFALALLCFAAESRAQNPAINERDAEWQGYKLPATKFIRYTDPTRALTFRVPEEWKQQGSELLFKGPGADLRVVVDTIPDGIPLRGYIASMTQQLNGLPGGADALQVRRTQMCGVEARELMFEMADERGVMTRRIIWTAVDGPRAVSFIFFTPVARSTEAQPYFKAVVQSAMLSVKVTDAGFLFTYPGKVKENEPARISEVLELVESLDSIDPPARAKAISSLAKVFASSPEAAIDLFKDRRPMIRVAAIEAVEMSRNADLTGFLIEALDDIDSFVAEQAAKAFAALKPEFGKELLSDMNNWQIWGFQKILRLSPFVDEATRAQIVAALFKQSGTKKRLAPPAPLPKPASKSTHKTTKPPPDSFEAKEISPAERISVSELAIDESLLALNLLRNVSVSNLKTPLADIIARKDDRIITAALQVALVRRERLPVDPLIKLLASSSWDVRWYAAFNLGTSASPADIARIESFCEKLSVESKEADKDRDNKTLADELRVSIKKIRLLEQLASASGESRNQIIKQALSDAQVATWAWHELVRDDVEGSKEGAAASPTAAKQQGRKPAIEVMPFGENAFPEKVTHYLAVPDPSSAIKKFGDSLMGLKMETARSQADLVLMLSSLRERLGQSLDVPSDGALLDYVGIKSDAPVAFATWNPKSVSRSVVGAERRAIVLRVSDRDRFEHLLALYQKQLGNFAGLPNYVSIGARAMSIAPAFLPLIAGSVLKDGITRPKSPAKSEFNLIGQDNCLGYPVKIIERREINPRGGISSDSIYLAYVGSAALLAPDWYSLRDVLARLASAEPKLSANAEFKRAVAAGGDAIYLSSLTEVLDSLGTKSARGDDTQATESGSLKFSSTTWENSFQFSFKEGAWAKPLAPFHPSELSAPRDLLPASTIGYYFMKAGANDLWREWASTLFSPDDLKQFASVWAMDFEKEILSELGPECGLALLGLPGYNGEEFDAPWIIFFKLKSEKVSRALSEGKLIKGVAAGTPAPRIKLAGVDVALTVKNGHLIIAGRETTLARLDAKERLDSARDFARAAKAAPAGVVAFGGYNHEAAIAEIKIPSNDPAMAQVASAMLSVARAFHSQNFYATTNAGQLDARMSVSLDLGGRYPVQDISRHKDYRLTFAVIEAGGIPIVDQKSLESLKLRIRTKTQGAIDSIKQDIAMANQEADKRSEEEIVLTMRPRRFAKPGKIQLPISGAEFADFLKPTHDIRSDDKSIIERARAIVGDDRDAWSVARKLSDWTYKNLKWKRVDYADAAQTLATREADCTEFSELFVAMARSLGLPARMVTGFAHSSGSFGGHAWVEVYAGEWVELDPTFGTDFVDATHIRESSNELIGYAALSLVQIDTLEAVRGVFEFQRDAKTLAEKLCEELPTGEQNALTASLDLAALADEYVGTGAWDKMSERERAQMSAAYRKVLAEMASKFSADEEDGEGMRLLKLTKTGDRAEAIVIGYSDDEEMLMRFKLARRGDAWRLTEIVEVDTGLQLISSMLQPAAQGILDRRSGKTASKPQAALEQELLALTDFAAAIELVDKALKDEPKNRNLRFIKALALSANDKQEETVKLLNELSGEEPPLARAVYLLAARYQGSEQAEDHKRAIELFERYVALEPDDPRPLSALAALYQQAGDAPRAEAKYLAAIDRDPQHADRHIDLAQFLISVHRYPEALAALDKGESPLNTKDQLYTALLARYSYAEDYATAEALVAAHPERLAKNFDAIMMLARIRMESGNAKEALPLLKKANQLKPESAEAHTSMADAYRKLKNWPAALAAADTALRIDGENFLAFYHRACALARLGRKQEAMLALKRAAEMLESISISHFIEDEEDLRPLAGLAEFKQLLKKKDEK